MRKRLTHEGQPPPVEGLVYSVCSELPEINPSPRDGPEVLAKWLVSGGPQFARLLLLRAQTDIHLARALSELQDRAEKYAAIERNVRRALGRDVV